MYISLSAFTGVFSVLGFDDTDFGKCVKYVSKTHIKSEALEEMIRLLKAG